MVPRHRLELLQGIGHHLRSTTNRCIWHSNNFIIITMKKIEIEIPEGKEVQWVDDTLKLVDTKKPITERIKTFDDAVRELGNHPFVKEYALIDPFNRSYSSDIVAYLRLRIIVAALNEGWEPKFTEDEYRYFPWFYLYTKEEYDKLDYEEKRRCVLRSGPYTSSFYGFVYCYAIVDASSSSTGNGSRLAFKTKELAEYAGSQFVNIYANLYL